MREVRVEAENGSYGVVVGRGVFQRAANDISLTSKASTSFIVADENLPETLTTSLHTALESAGVPFRTTYIEASETTKSLQAYEQLCRWLVDSNAERTSSVVAFGGGIVGDLAGFVAATFHRGIPLFQVPTTLLSMVDASVGGKVAVNLSGLKNILGRFHQPHGVYADVDALSSLGLRQVRCGLAECLKHGILDSRELFDWTTDNLDMFLERDSGSLIDLISRNVAFKARIVEEDATERSIRATLNLGHTFGHAIEKVDDERTFFHGEAISIGTVAACHFGASKGICSEELLATVESSYAKAGLPIRHTLEVEPDAFVHAMRQDKKSAFTKLRLIIPVELGKVTVYDDPTDAELLDSFRYVTGSHPVTRRPTRGGRS